MPALRDDLVVFRHLFLAHRPAHQAWMQPAGSVAKYQKKFHAVTATEIAAHLTGRITVAVPLIGRDNQADATALDIDAGGAAAVRAVLDNAAAGGYHAFGIVSCAMDTAGHNGGHVWLLFDDPASPDPLRQLANALARAAAVVAETYPTRKTLRLPLGMHRWTGRRGQLLLQDHTTLDLDSEPGAWQRALRIIADLPRNPVAMLPPAPEPARPVPAGSQTRSTGSGATQGIRAYNRATDLLALLEAAGGRIAERYHDGGMLLHCPCPNHAHDDQDPSLEVRPATSSRYGRYVAYGYAPGCLFYTEHGQIIDAFGVYCRLHNLTSADAVKQLARATPAGARQEGPTSSQASLVEERGAP